MKRGLAVIFLMFLLIACTAKTVPISQQTQTETSQPAQVATPSQPTQITVSLEPKFIVQRQFGLKYPVPSVNGTIKNIGNATGDADVTVTVYYAKVVSDQKKIVIKDVAPGEVVTFGVNTNPTAQWTSYSIVAEVAK